MAKTISLISLLVITAVNAAVVFMLSLLATGGDGSATGVYVVLAVGEFFVAGFFLVALRRWWLDNLTGVRVVLVAIPALIAASMVVGVVLVLLRSLGLRVG